MIPFPSKKYGIPWAKFVNFLPKKPSRHPGSRGLQQQMDETIFVLASLGEQAARTWYGKKWESFNKSLQALQYGPKYRLILWLGTVWVTQEVCGSSWLHRDASASTVSSIGISFLGMTPIKTAWKKHGLAGGNQMSNMFNSYFYKNKVCLWAELVLINYQTTYNIIYHNVYIYIYIYMYTRHTLSYKYDHILTMLNISCYHNIL